MTANPMVLLHDALWGKKNVKISPLDVNGNWSGLAVFHDGIFALMVNVSPDKWPALKEDYQREAAALGFTGELQPVAPGSDWHIQDAKRVRAQGVGFGDVVDDLKATLFYDRVVEPNVEEALRTPLVAAPAAASRNETYDNKPGKAPWLSCWVDPKHQNIVVRCPKDHPGIGKLKAAGFTWKKSPRYWNSADTGEYAVSTAIAVVGYHPRDGQPTSWQDAPLNWREIMGASAAAPRPTVASNKTPGAPGLHLDTRPEPAPNPTLPQAPAPVPSAPAAVVANGPAPVGQTPSNQTHMNTDPPVEDGPADGAVKKRGRGRPRKEKHAIATTPEIMAMSDDELAAAVEELESGTDAAGFAQDPRPKTQDPRFVTIIIPAQLAANGFTLKFEPR